MLSLGVSRLCMYLHSRAHIRMKQGLEKDREHPLIANTRCCSIISNNFKPHPMNYGVGDKNDDNRNICWLL